jgi:hypothetical protein
VIFINIHRSFIDLMKKITITNQSCFSQNVGLKMYKRLMTFECYFTVIYINQCHIVDHYGYYIRYHDNLNYLWMLYVYILFK